MYHLERRLKAGARKCLVTGRSQVRLNLHLYLLVLRIKVLFLHTRKCLATGRSQVRLNLQHEEHTLSR